MVMYHGTDATFTEFTNGDTGFHFGSRQAAENRMDGVGNSNIMPVYIRMESPLTIDYDIGDWGGQNVADFLANDDPDAVSYEFTKEDKAVLREIAALKDDGKYDSESSVRMRDFLKSKGFDGIKYINDFEDDGGYSYIAFDGNQVKSADGSNVGTFFNESNDIQWNLGSEQGTVRDFLMDLNPDTLRTQAEKEILRRYREASGKMQEIRGQMDEIQGRLNENAYENEIARKQDQNRMTVLRNQLERQNDIILEMEGNNGLGQMVRNVQNVLQHELAGLDHDGLDASIRELQAREADIQERLRADIKNLPKVDQLREIAKIYYKPAVLDQMARSLRRGGGMSTDEVRRSVYELAIAWAEMSANIDDGVKSAKAAERFNARVAALANNAVDNQVSSTALSELQDEIADSDVNLPLSLNDAEVAALKEHGVSVAEYARMIGMVGRVHVNHQARTTYAEDNWWNNNTDHNLDEDVVTPVSAIFGQLSYGDAAYGPWQVYEKFAAARAAEDNMMYPYGENVKDGHGYKTRGEAVAAATADIVNQLVSDGLPNFNAANISDAGKLAQMIAAVGAKFQSNLDTRKALEERLAQSERAMETYATLRGGVTDSASGMVGYLMDYADRVSQSYAETSLAEADTWRENDL